MKKSELERRLRELGWFPTGTGTKHEKWTNGKGQITVLPHNKGEIPTGTAASITKKAQQNPGN